MCGITFLIAGTPSEHLRACTRAALDRIAHRGPDEHGLVDGPGWVAGHNRLAIIDLTGGHQRMRDPTGRHVLTFNGEIYNYQALRAELAERWQFRDHSDTEVLLAGLVLDGPAFLSRLLGMWAFVLYDSVTGEMLMARDIVGKKPLYYRNTGGQFACASELPALRALLPDELWAEDEDSTADFFRYGYALPGRTEFRDGSEVLPGPYLHRDREGRLVETRYWQPSTSPFTGTFRDAADAMAEALDRAIRRRLVADVEVGAFLSGGVDSSLVVSRAQQALGGRLRTYTIGFPERSFDERGHADKVARHFNTRHTSGEISDADARHLVGELCDHLGQPFGDASIVPTGMVAKLASRDLKVVLSGDGSDELFGGYSRYLGRRFNQAYRRLPAVVRSAVEAAVGVLPSTVDHHSSSLRKKAQLFVALSREAERAGRYHAPRPAPRDDTDALTPQLSGRGHAEIAAPWPDHADDVMAMMRADLLVYLPQDILAKVDRATMASSLESRSPFLDKDVIELALRLPPGWHFGPLRGKRLLHAACRDWIPDYVWNRRKQGFGSPVGFWLKGWMGDELEQLLRDGSGHAIDVAHALRMLEEHRLGRSDHASALWMVYSYLRWRQGLAALAGP